MHEEALTNPTKDIYVPQCSFNGSFVDVQCHGASNECWCVDQQGDELTGTRSKGPLRCDGLGLFLTFILTVLLLFSGLELQHRPAWRFSIGFLLWRLTAFDTSNPKFCFEFLPQVFLSIFLGRAIDSLNYRWVLSAYGFQMRSWS